MNRIISSFCVTGVSGFCDTGECGGSYTLSVPGISLKNLTISHIERHQKGFMKSEYYHVCLFGA